LVIDPSNSSTIYAGCGPWGIFKSVDGGATWNAANTGLPVGSTTPTVLLDALLIDPKQPGTLYTSAANSVTASGGGGVYKSWDGAESWSLIWTPGSCGLPEARPVESLTIDPQNPNTLYVEDYISSICKSTDGGQSWNIAHIVSSGGGSLNLHAVVVDPGDSNTLYGLSYSSGVMKSSDGGASWSVTPLGGGPAWVTVAPTAAGPSTVYAGGDWRGVLKSVDGGMTWARSNAGLTSNSIDSLAIDPQNPRNLYAGVNGAGLFKTTDGARTWSAAPISQVFYEVAVDPRNEGSVYAWDGDGVRKSVDGGQSWAQLSLPEDDAGSLAIDTRNPDNIYYFYATGYGYKSTDGGANWAKLSSFPGFISALATDPQSSGTLYAGSVAGQSGAAALTYSSGVLKSVDGGANWNGVNTQWQSVAVSKIVVDPANSNIVYAQTGDIDCGEYPCSGYVSSDPEVVKEIGLYASYDGGVTWAKLELPGGVAYQQLLGVDQRATVYASTIAGLVRSQDGGATWSPLPAFGQPTYVHELVFDPLDADHLFAGTYGAGLFEIRLAAVRDTGRR
jgi:photosystem II stability/assembly factor-like uncharacterized protein